MNSKSKSASITQKIANLAKKRGVPFEFLATEFLIERLVSRLVANSKLSKSLIFKGGFVGLRVYNSSRYTIDLDALLKRSNIESTLDLTRTAAETDLNDGVWFRFEDQIDLQTQGECGGIRQIFRVGFGEIPKKISQAQILNFDLGIGDPVEPIETIMTPLLSDEKLSWSIYPIETIIAEKLHALIDRGELNSRSKDIYDLSVFLPNANKSRLQSALKNCFKYRETELPDRFSDILKTLDTRVLERGWQSAVKSISDAPDFQAAYDKLISYLEDFENHHPGGRREKPVKTIV